MHLSFTAAALWLAAQPFTAAAAEPPAATRIASAPRTVDFSRTPVWLELSANGAGNAVRLVLLDSDGDVWVAEEDLAALGLNLSLPGQRIEQGERSMVSLRSLAPEIAFTFDETALAVRIEARQEVLGTTRFDLATLRRPSPIVRRDSASGWLNWSARADSLLGESGAAELGANVGPALLLGGATISEAAGVVRGLTTGYFDDDARLIRYAAGDVVVIPGDSLGGTAVVLGAGSWREFSLDPYFMRAPYPRTSIFSPTPATLEVWVDDSLVRRSTVAPGTIDLENLPVNVGVSEVRTVLRDPFGRETSASTFALLGSTALAPGLVDWGAAAGFARRGLGTTSFDYGPPLAFARLRAGISSTLTLSGRAEGGESVLNAGGGAAVVTPLGELEALGAASRVDGEAGAGLQLSWRRLGRWGGLSAGLRCQSRRYGNASLTPDAERVLLRGNVVGSVGITRGLTVLGELAAERYRDAGDGLRGSLRALWVMDRRGTTLSLSASRTAMAGGPDSWLVSAQVTSRLFEKVNGNAAGGFGDGGGGSYADFSIHRPLAPGPGYGFRAQARTGPSSTVAADLQAQSTIGRLELSGVESEPWGAGRSGQGSAQVASGLVWIDGRLFVTPPVDGSYALVRLDAAPDVRVLLENHEVGRTDANGEILVPGLLPYMGNRLSIRDSDLPLDFRVNETERIVAPRYRAGTVEKFDVGPVHVVVGRVLLAIDEKGKASDVAPEWGEIAVELPTGRIVSPIGADGTFWLEGMAAGRQEALVRWEGRLCRFTLEVPKKPGIVDVGLQRCVQMLAAGGAPNEPLN